MSGNYKLRGYIITYKSSNRKDITRINYYLFGRIATIKQGEKIEKYYYPGVFETLPFKKITNGCYFTGSLLEDNCDGLIEIFPAIVNFSDDKLITARDCWKDKIEGQIKNW